MNFFEHIQKAPPDPIFGVRIAFDNDPRSHKVNLGIGVYRTEDLKPFVLPSVKKTEELLLKKEKNKEYLPISGDPEFIEETTKLVFGNEIDKDTIAAVQSVGGTNALMMGGEFLIKHVAKEIFLSSPTWDNHHRIFSTRGFKLSYYPYYDKKNRCFDKKGMLESLQKCPKRSVLFLQGCCHNPTGFDPSRKDWSEIVEIAKKRELIIFFDIAYQGFGDGIEEDAYALRLFAKAKLPVLVGYSYSKNFGLYSERVGALFIVSPDKETKEKIQSQLNLLIRSLYSNPPSHGAKTIAYILKDPQLRKHWEEELGIMRKRINDMRKALYKSLVENNSQNKERFAFLTEQKGMFSFTGLEPNQVERLQQEYAIYMLKEGRINVAGLNHDNLDYVSKAIDAVC